MSNIAKYRNIIMDLLKKDYPDLKRNIFLANGDILNERELVKYLNEYMEKYGDYMLIKSIKKETVKKLKLV